MDRKPLAVPPASAPASARALALSLALFSVLFLALTLSLTPRSAGAEGRAGAAEPIPAGARLAATCTGCHGTNGATRGNAVPSLAGQPKAALLASLMAFKSGERPATVMTQLSKGYTDEQLDQIAAFFSVQQPAVAAQSLSGSGS